MLLLLPLLALVGMAVAVFSLPSSDELWLSIRNDTAAPVVVRFEDPPTGTIENHHVPATGSTRGRPLGSQKQTGLPARVLINAHLQAGGNARQINAGSLTTSGPATLVITDTAISVERPVNGGGRP